MKVGIKLEGFDKDYVSVRFDAWYLIGGTKSYPARTEDGVTWWAEIEGHPRTITPNVTYTTVTIDPNSDSTVTVNLVPDNGD